MFNNSSNPPRSCLQLCGPIGYKATAGYFSTQLQTERERNRDSLVQEIANLQKGNQGVCLPTQAFPIDFPSIIRGLVVTMAQKT